jgi:hypothetical protein
MRYTIRGIPHAVDVALRERARVSGKSLSEVAIEALAVGAGVTDARRKQRNLDDIAGSWKASSAFEDAIAAQDQVDEDVWK